MSIFQIKKISLDQAPNNPDKKVSTVNFYSNPKTDLGKAIPGLDDYFDSRSNFLSLCYEAAKEYKVKRGEIFDDSAATQAYMQEWLLENSPQTKMITGTEFGLLTTKLRESVKSIEKNKYITELIDNIKLFLFKKENNIEQSISKKDFFKNKEYRSKINAYYPAINDVLNIDDAVLSKLFKYALIEQTGIIKEFLEKLSREYDTFENLTIERTIYKITTLESKLSNIWHSSIEYAKNHLSENPPSSPSNLIESFVLSLYFKFDIDCRKVEDIYTPEINSDLNRVSQNFGNHIIETYDLADRDSKINLKLLWNLDWTSDKSVDKFFKLLKKIIDNQIEKEDLPDSSNYNWRISHPKSAPSFPKKSSSLVNWDCSDRTSRILDANKHDFISLKFIDYLIKKSLSNIRNNEGFRVYSFISQTNFSPIDWLLDIINDKNLTELKISSEKINIEKIIKDKDRKKVNLSIIRFCYDVNNLNKRLPIIKTIKDIDPYELTSKWIEKRYNDMVKLNPEIYLLKELIRNQIIGIPLIKKWKEVVLGKDGINQKLEFKTENRINILESHNFAINIDPSKIVDFIMPMLSKLEKHLLLDNDHQLFAISDYAAFKKYQRFTESALQGSSNKSILNNQKYLLSEIKKDFVDHLAIKIDRMTATKPQGKSTLIFEIEDDEIISSKAFTFIYPIKSNDGVDAKLFDDLEKARKFLSKNQGKLYCGFLNGSKDHTAEKEVVELIKNDGTPGRYQQFLERKIIDSKHNVEYIDKFRPARTERLAGTNPSGYPKLYYFWIPDNCSNLIVPVQINKYYLKKYTPYHLMGKYIELEKKLLNQVEVEKKIYAMEILKLRSYLRYYYSISSIEIDLIRKYYVSQDPESNLKSIKSKISAAVHTQFQNPTKNTHKYIENYTPKYVLSIDLGEKLLASATLSKVKNDKLSPILQTFLPIKGYNNSSKGTSGFKELLKELKNSNKPIIISTDKDDSFNSYKDFSNNYKRYQRRIGKTSEKLRNKRENLSESYAEHIAAQIVKLANEFNATIVFEDLRAGFGRKDTIQIYKQIKDQVINLLDKIGKIELFTNSYKSNYFAEVPARYTSKKCSDCDYIPITSTKENKFIEIDDNWKDKGKISFYWKDALLLEITDNSGSLKIANKYEEITSNTNSRVHFFKNRNKQTDQINLYEFLNRKMYSSKTYNRISTNKTIHKLLIEKFLNPRQSQDKFICPNCGYSNNADYNASLNIGQKYIDRINEK